MCNKTNEMTERNKIYIITIKKRFIYHLVFEWFRGLSHSLL